MRKAIFAVSAVVLVSVTLLGGCANPDYCLEEDLTVGRAFRLVAEAGAAERAARAALEAGKDADGEWRGDDDSLEAARAAVDEAWRASNEAKEAASAAIDECERTH
jgi:hypothetical protein